MNNVYRNLNDAEWNWVLDNIPGDLTVDDAYLNTVTGVILVSDLTDEADPVRVQLHAPATWTLEAA